MKRVASAVTILTAALFTIGCGGGGGGTTPDTKVRVDLTGADWAAYAASPWREVDMSNLPADGIFSFEPAQDGRYSVAIHCKEGNREIKLIHATRKELPVIDALCEDSDPPRYHVSGTIHDVNGSSSESLIVYIDGERAVHSSIDGKKSVDYTIGNVKKGIYDLVALKTESFLGYKGVKRYGVKREINVDKNVSGEDINLSSEGIAAVKHDFTVSGADSRGYCYFITANRTVAAGIGFAENGTPGSWFALESGTGKGDIYMFVSGSSDDADTKIIFDGKDATKDPADVTYDPNIIAPLGTDVTYDGNISGLDYTPASDSPALRLYDISMEQNGDDMREIWITAGWLGSADSYTLPALDTLNGWKTEWSMDKTSPLSWSVTAIMADRTFSEALDKMIDYATVGLPLFRLQMTMHWAEKRGESLNQNGE